MSWFQRFPDRLEHEKQVVGALLSEGWVTRVDWNVDAVAGVVTAEVDFEAGAVKREAKLVYPFVYPFCPLQVMPRTEGERWSTHQWPSGELCLEMRADNWHPDFDGADMLRSAHKLLNTEATVDSEGVRHRVQNDHRFTDAQFLNASDFRLVVSDALKAEVRRRGLGVHGLDLYGVIHERCIVFFAVGLSGSGADDRWLDPGVPPHFSANPNRVARIAALEKDDDRHKALTDKKCTPAEIWAHFSGVSLNTSGIVVGLLGAKAISKLVGNEVEDVIEVPMDNQKRIPERNDAFPGKKVAIVGCGSMGSKVATSMVRSGVAHLFLVDGDVMKSGNLARNDLDWRSIGAHKVDGVIARLRNIRPNVVVDSWVGRLGGQHSTTALITCLEQLASCDLIVETTASGQGFGFASSVATQDRVPMVWGRVFGGGYGGYIARSRPGLEAQPQDVQHEIYTWMTEPDKPKPPRDSDIDYGAEPEDQQAMVADDADVSVISAHLARMALDALRPAEQTDYPYSAYVIGLRKEWLFEQPFEVHPLRLKAAPENAQTANHATQPEGASAPVVARSERDA